MKANETTTYKYKWNPAKAAWMPVTMEIIVDKVIDVPDPDAEEKVHVEVSIPLKDE